MYPDEKRRSFELKRLAEYTDEAILDEMCRVASIVTEGAPTVAVFEKHARVSRSAITRRFGSWGAALQAAGLAHRFSEHTGAPGARASQRMTDGEILQALRELAGRLGKQELTIDDVRGHLPFSGEALRRRWGTSRAAFEAAGLSSTKVGRRYTDEDCFDNLLTVWTHYGCPPMYREMSSPPSKVGGKAYVSRFGTWNKALTAFAERVNADVAPKVAAEMVINTAPEFSSSTRKPADSHDVPLGLRFKVLRRDLFKCVLCGDNPPQNPQCVLHVDHMLPWSKGGKTTIENLRTLCASCNVGRGNRYDE